MLDEERNFGKLRSTAAANVDVVVLVVVVSVASVRVAGSKSEGGWKRKKVGILSRPKVTLNWVK